MTWFLLWYLPVGAVAGVMAGLMGIGGGLIVVPALLLLFHLQEFDPDVLAHMAIGTSLAVIAPVALSSLWAHHRRGAVDWQVVGFLAPGLMLGAWSGAWLADQMDTLLLKLLFGLFLLAVAVQMITGRLPRSAVRETTIWQAMPVGGAVGLISGLVGIGGGTMTVPWLVWRGKPLPRAVATSAACGLPIALAGTLGFIHFGDHQAIAGVSGYVYWPAAGVIAMLAVITAPLGAQLAHSLPVGLLRRIFALLLVLVGLRLAVISVLEIV